MAEGRKFDLGVPFTAGANSAQSAGLVDDPLIGPLPGESPFFDYVVSHTARNDPVIKKLLAAAAGNFDVAPISLLEPIPEVYGFPKGSRYIPSAQAWLTPEGILMETTDPTQRPN